MMIPLESHSSVNIMIFFSVLHVCREKNDTHKQMRTEAYSLYFSSAHLGKVSTQSDKQLSQHDVHKFLKQPTIVKIIHTKNFRKTCTHCEPHARRSDFFVIAASPVIIGGSSWRYYFYEDENTVR